MYARKPLTIQCLMDLLAAAAMHSETPAPQLVGIEEGALLDQDRFIMELEPFTRLTQDHISLSHPFLYNKLRQENTVQ